MEYKRFSIYVLGGAICILVAVASFCYRVDPGNIFRNVLVETCGEWLLKGHDVSITQNYDERLLQKYLIEYGTKIMIEGRCGIIEMMDTGILDLDREHDFESMQVVAKYLFANVPGYNDIYGYSDCCANELTEIVWIKVV